MNKIIFIVLFLVGTSYGQMKGQSTGMAMTDTGSVATDPNNPTGPGDIFNSIFNQLDKETLRKLHMTYCEYENSKTKPQSIIGKFGEESAKVKDNILNAENNVDGALGEGKQLPQPSVICEAFPAILDASHIPGMQGSMTSK